MKSKVEINEFLVLSDKEVDSVINKEVCYRDGSWCNVSSYEIYNTGKGYIHLARKRRGTHPLKEVQL